VAWNSLDILVVEGKKRLPISKLIMLDPRGEIDEAMATERFEQVRAILYPIGDESRARELARFAPGAAILCRDDLESILALVQNDFKKRVPPLKGVVLVGGLSTRMKLDKAGLSYRDGQSQARRSVDLLSSFCNEVFLAAREDQELPTDCDGTTRINDRFVSFGPVGGILTALIHDPFSAWFVLSCDLPLIEAEDLRQLVGERDPLSVATAFCSQGGAVLEDAGRIPEPLIAIYEPKARTRLLGGLIRGVESPRWLLRIGSTKLVSPMRNAALFNANRSEEYRQALMDLSVE
jgi:molybdopterin-guanine dinucleotide biosynthesis protein A